MAWHAFNYMNGLVCTRMWRLYEHVVGFASCISHHLVFLDPLLLLSLPLLHLSSRKPLPPVSRGLLYRVSAFRIVTFLYNLSGPIVGICLLTLLSDTVGSHVLTSMFFADAKCRMFPQLGTIYPRCFGDKDEVHCFFLYRALSDAPPQLFALIREIYGFSTTSPLGCIFYSCSSAFKSLSWDISISGPTSTFFGKNVMLFIFVLRLLPHRDLSSLWFLPPLSMRSNTFSFPPFLVLRILRYCLFCPCMSFSLPPFPWLCLFHSVCPSLPRLSVFSLWRPSSRLLLHLPHLPYGMGLAWATRRFLLN